MSKNLVKLTGEVLQGLKPTDLPEHEAVQDKFISLYNSIHGTTQGELIYHKETFNFKRMIAENKVLQECTPLSLYGVFLDVAVNGLSLDSGSKPLAYVIPRNANVGTRETPRWEKRAYLVVSPYGELVMRIRAGQIKHADNPVIVYEGDTFSIFIDATGNKQIEYRACIPRTSTKIIAAFIKLVRPDNTMDFEYLTMEDIARFKGFSEKNNRGTANALYSSVQGSIDPGFLASKMIKHAFRTFPAVRTKGAMTVTETQIEAEDIDYGLVIAPATETKSVEEVDEAQVVSEQPEEKAEPVPVTQNESIF